MVQEIINNLSPEYQQWLTEDTGPTAQDAVNAVIAAEGDLDLAAERMFGPVPLRPDPLEPTSKSRLISLLSKDSIAFADLQKQLRVLTLLKTFQTSSKVNKVIEGTLHNQQPGDLVRLYNNLLNALTELTDDHTSTQNLNANLSVGDSLLGSLPPPVREALKVIMMEPVNKLPMPGDEYPEPTPNVDIEDVTHSLLDPLPNAADGTS